MFRATNSIQSHDTKTGEIVSIAKGDLVEPGRLAGATEDDLVSTGTLVAEDTAPPHPAPKKKGDK